MYRLLLPALFLFSFVTLAVADECPLQPLRIERLPNLHIPRTGHQVFCVNGEVLVAGGHTSGFVPTPTAEYFANGEWHLLSMVYTHDQGLGIQMTTGKIILSGGHEQSLGIGQTYTVERYDPAGHAFEGYGCLEQKRCFAQTLELDSGYVMISGNWYADDAIELFDGSRQCHYVKDVAQHRSQPYILRTAKDNAIIFSSNDIHDEPFDTIIIDRLHGEPFTDSLLTAWRPFHSLVNLHPADAFIGDEADGYYASLLEVINNQGQVAVAKVEGETFSLLPTATPIPMQSQWGPITYFGYPVVDRNKKVAYMMATGSEADRRLYVLCIDYAATPAPLTLYYTEPQDSIGLWQPVLTPEGNLLIVGGPIDSNFTPASSALLLCLGKEPPATSTKNSAAWLWLLTAAVLLAMAVTTVVLLRRRKSHSGITQDTTAIAANPDDDAKLMLRICQLMEQEQLFLNSELKLADVAKRVATNSTYLSACINSQRSCSFSQFVNAYRVAYAQRLLTRQPGKRVSEVWPISGFSNEKTFFRTFKAIVGKTPTEWKQEMEKGAADNPPC